MKKQNASVWEQHNKGHHPQGHLRVEPSSPGLALSSRARRPGNSLTASERPPPTFLLLAKLTMTPGVRHWSVFRMMRLRRRENPAWAGNSQQGGHVTGSGSHHSSSPSGNGDKHTKAHKNNCTGLQNMSGPDHMALLGSQAAATVGERHETGQEESNKTGSSVTGERDVTSRDHS